MGERQYLIDLTFKACFDATEPKILLVYLFQSSSSSSSSSDSEDEYEKRRRDRGRRQPDNRQRRGRRQKEELDPMDPAAYSEVPRLVKAQLLFRYH